MIKAELSHNPYLLETAVSFNGLAPRINSQVEKYEHLPLIDWVQSVPAIFYSEMNGYGFELDFSGTSGDFEEVEKAFLASDAPAGSIVINHTTELGDCDVKRLQISELLTWLRDNSNDRFDFEAFKNCHLDLFDETIPLIAVRGSLIDLSINSIGLERVESASELESTDLSLTPIIIFVDEATREQARADISCLIKRPDTNEKQLFFVIQEDTEKSRATRVISDLGIDKPQVVSGYGDDTVLRYLRFYPATQFVRDGIRAFDKAASSIRADLDLANTESAHANKDAHKKISAIELELAKLKQIDEYFANLPRYDLPNSFSVCVADLHCVLSKWRDRKAKITGEESGSKHAEEFAGLCQRALDDYSRQIGTLYEKEENRIWCEFEEAYRRADVDSGYSPYDVKIEPYGPARNRLSKSDFLKLHKEYYVDPKADIFNMIMHHGADGMIRVVDYYLDVWRNEASTCLDEIAREHNIYWKDRLESYRAAQVSAYRAHIAELIEDRLHQKDFATSQLSETEKLLQRDLDWFAVFEGKLEKIKRA